MWARKLDRNPRSNSKLTSQPPLQQKSICTICKCTVSNDMHQSHLQQYHVKEYLDVQRKKEVSKPGFITVKLDYKTVLDACIELVTVNGCAFDLMMYSGFKKIVNPILAGFGDSVSNTPVLVRRNVTTISSKLIEAMKLQMQNRMVCLKIDIASKLNQAVVAINAQYVNGGKICLFTLAIKKLKERHNGVYFRKVVCQVLDMYGISVHQIHSITTDNGNNTAKFAQLLGEDVGNIDDDPLDINLSNECGDLELPNKLIGVRCAALSLQLAINDALKQDQVGEVLIDCRNLVHKICLPSAVDLKFTENGLQKPVLDSPSRWSSTYDMLKTLMPYRQFLKKQVDSNYLDYFLSTGKWDKAEVIMKTLEPLKEVTMKLQSDQATMSDFFAHWLEIKVILKKLPNWFSNILLEFVDNRGKCLIEDECILGAVFLDPRYQILLSTSEKVKAKQHLNEVWSLINSLGKTAVKQNRQNQNKETNIHNSDEMFEEFLKMREEDSELRNLEQDIAVKQVTDFNKPVINIENIVSGFDGVTRLARQTGILQFWEENRTKYPVLYQLANIVFAVPATQVSVERVLSGLKYILQCNRDSLDENILEDVQLIRSNFAFYLEQDYFVLDYSGSQLS